MQDERLRCARRTLSRCDGLGGDFCRRTDDLPDGLRVAQLGKQFAVSLLELADAATEAVLVDITEGFFDARRERVAGRRFVVDHGSNTGALVSELSANALLAVAA